MPREMGDRSGEMEAFEAIVGAGSLSDAARALDLTPSALSRMSSRIERRLGVRLLVRTTRSLTLTAEGDAYHRAARRILTDLRDTESLIADQAAPRGRLRVSAALAHGRRSVVPLIGSFVERYPGILVDLNLSDAIVDVLGGQADVAVRFGPLADSPLTARRLGVTGRTIIASPAYCARAGVPEQPEDLLRHNCLNFNFRRIDPGWPFRRGTEQFELAVNGNVEANNGETLVQLVHQGIGIARVGHFHVADDIAGGRLVSLLDGFNPGDTEEINAVFVGGPHVPARVRVFVDYLAENLSGFVD